MAPSIVWYRKEFQDREELLEDREGFDARRGLSKGALQSRFYAYNDRVPEMVKKVDHRQYFVASELDAFFDSIKGHDNPRTPAERLTADVVRRQKTVDEHRARVEKKQAELDKAKRQLNIHEQRLKSVETELKLYS